MIFNFISKSLILVSIVVFVCYLIQITIAPKIRSNNEYVTVTIDKEKTLSELPSNKLVFVGGSNLTFGLDCKKIKKSLNIPVINMAVHGGLGLDFMLKETVNNIKSGDIIVLSSEYYLPQKGDTKLLACLLDANPKASKYVINNIQDYIKYKVIEWQRCISGLFYKITLGDLQTIYKRDNFTEEGDMIGHLDEPLPLTRSNQEQKMLITDYSKEISTINDFVKTVNSLNAKVYYAFPCFPSPEYELSKEAIDSFQNQMQKGLECEIINTPQTFLLDYKYFFDTVYHLNRLGREKRTDLMIDILKKLK